MRRPLFLIIGVAAVSIAGPSFVQGAENAPPLHLIYLHGRIVQEQQSPRPAHPQYGAYELEKILAAFRARGFTVTGEIRPREASVSDAADHVVTQVRALIASGVPPDRITVVGASMGAGIAIVAAARLQEPRLRFALLGACLSRGLPAITQAEGKEPAGRVLSIWEASDDTAGECPAWTADPQAGRRLVAREIVLHTGLSHGFLYRPLPEWVDPVADWAHDR